MYSGRNIGMIFAGLLVNHGEYDGVCFSSNPGIDVIDGKSIHGFRVVYLKDKLSSNKVFGIY